jgi:hypothetical protein
LCIFDRCLSRVCYLLVCCLLFTSPVRQHESSNCFFTLVSELLQSDVMVLNKPYYAVSSVWFSAFQAFVQGDGLHPGVLDNSPLANVNGEHVVVKPDILPDQYKFVSAQVWMRLVAWYGPAISIARSVVRLNTHYVLDMFPIDVRVDYLGFQFKVGEDKRIFFLTKFFLLSQLPLSRFNRMRMVRHWAATAVSITPHRAEIMIVESLPVNAVPVAGAREPRQLSDAQMSLSLHEMQFGDSVLLLLNAISNNFNFMLPPGNNHNYSIRQERDVVREREEVREMHGDGFQHMEVERHRDHPRDRQKKKKKKKKRRIDFLSHREKVFLKKTGQERE